MWRIKEIVSVFVFISACLIFTSVYAQGEVGDIGIKVMTYNIKYDDKRDSINNWEKRKDRVVGLLQYHLPDIFGTQEGLHHQLEDIGSDLPAFKYLGVSRDDGDKKGEYSAFFYNIIKFKPLESGTFWLSKTPDVPSKGWDAAFPRVCSWAKLEVIESGQQFLVFNTHFDHVGEIARLESTKLILKKIKEMAKGIPVILMGDFNFTPDAISYGVIVKSMEDAREATLALPYGPEATFNGFDFLTAPERRIDYIFCKGNLQVKSYATLSDNQNMSYPSDHFPVIAKIQFE